MFMKSLKLDNFMSFGESEAPVDMRALNVIIGPNGSGKSNFIDAIDFMRLAAVPSKTPSLPATDRRGGGAHNWIWKGASASSCASIEAVFDGSIFGSANEEDLKYLLSFSADGPRLKIESERIEGISKNRKGSSRIHFRTETVRDFECLEGGGEGNVKKHAPDERDSVLGRCRMSGQCQEVIDLGDSLAKVCLFRDWVFGPDSVMRQSRGTDRLRGHPGLADGDMGQRLDRVRSDSSLKRQYVSSLGELYDGIVDFDVRDAKGSMMVTVREQGGVDIPAVNLSDGALRYMYLLAILLDPDPAPLTCIEGPEFGLHPDVMPIVSDILLDASERTQLVVTTHSEMLVDCMTDHPEAVLVASRDRGGTRLERLRAERIEHWLKTERLGGLWMSGQIEGTRW